MFVTKLKKYELSDFLGDGWYAIEINHVWSRKTASLKFPGNSEGFSFELTGMPGAVYRVIILYNGMHLYESVTGLGPLLLNVPGAVNSCNIQLSEDWVPREKLGLNDTRSIGISVQNMSPMKSLLKRCTWYPIIIEMSLINKCNINPPCVMCVNRNSEEIKNIPDFSENNVKKMSPYFNYSKFISLHGSEGEPLLYPKLIDVLKLIDPKTVYTRFSSNGLLLSKELSTRLILAGLKEINISIDAANAETYHKIRNNNGFDKILHNIRQLTDLKKELNSPFPFIIINTVLMKENLSQFPQFIDLAHDLNVPTVHARFLVPLAQNYVIKTERFIFDYYDQRINASSEEFRQAIFIARKKALEYKIQIFSDNPEITAQLEASTTMSDPRKNIIDLHLHFTGIKKRYTAADFIQQSYCIHPWRNALIDISGKVRFCCHSLIPIGNLTQNDFWSVWNGKTARSIRRSILQSKFHPNCIACPVHQTQQQVWKNSDERSVPLQGLRKLLNRVGLKAK
jgi:MoaA/NifB/PqqE/SkfB family radical SAM enzyme